jgi:tetratricopeptide (TPR) repeat protein
LPHNPSEIFQRTTRHVQRATMSDPLRTDPLTPAPPEHSDVERDAKIESLLLAGLDHYFASNFTQAIDVWTRALFLDRNHARARAYIERARSALGEQQRESEELIHNGVAAFERGEIEAARQLLNAAVQRGGAHEVALAFLTRIDRISAAPVPIANTAAVAPARPTFTPAAEPVTRRRSRLWLPLLVIAGAAAVAAVLAPWSQVRELMPRIGLGVRSQTDLAPVRTAEEPLVVPRSSETALDRANALFASGRLYDAIRAVDLVRPTDPLRAEADKLKAAIQRELLAHAQMTPAPPSTAP